MARRVFFSFHYQRDIWRVNQIRNIPNVTGCAAAGFQDASIWEDAQAKGDDAVKKLIDNGLAYTSVTLVCIGAETAGRKYINYEINQSIERGNGILGVKIHHLKDEDGNTDYEGDTPYKLISGDYKVRKYTDVFDLANWIEEAAEAAGKWLSNKSITKPLLASAGRRSGRAREAAELVSSYDVTLQNLPGDPYF